MDAGYYSLELKIFLENHGIKYIFRLGSDVYKKEISQMTKIDENLKISNITSRRKSIKDKNILKKAKKLPYIESRIIKPPIINQNNKKKTSYSSIYIFNLAMILKKTIYIKI